MEGDAQRADGGGPAGPAAPAFLPPPRTTVPTPPAGSPAGQLRESRVFLTVLAALDMGVVAEGVETEGQLAELRAMDCRYLQGYLFGRPMPFAELPALLGRFDPSVLDTRRDRKWTTVSTWWDTMVDAGPREAHSDGVPRTSMLADARTPGVLVLA